MTTLSEIKTHLSRNRRNSPNLGNQSSSDKGTLSLLFIFLLLKPFYLWDSGLPQPADIVMAGLAFAVAARSRFSFPLSDVNRPFQQAVASFTAYIVFVNITAMLLLGGTNSFLLTALYYVYNLVVVVTVVAVVRQSGPSALRVLFFGALLSSILQSLLLTGGDSPTEFRTSGSFNNPNQLAYFGILTSSLFLFVSTRIKLPTAWVFAGLLSSTFIVIESLSKAGLAAQLILVLLFLLSSRRSQTNVRGLATAILLSSTLFAILFTFTPTIQSSGLYKDLQARMSSTTTDDSIFARGYSRLMDYPEYWIFGSGEGAYDRFDNYNEFHSTWGNIQLSYGLIGSLLFIAVTVYALRVNRFHDTYIVVSVMTYGLAHNGIRNPVLWILIGLIASVERPNRHSNAILSPGQQLTP